MIVRMVEAKVVAGATEALAELVRAALDRLSARDGFLGYELLRPFDSNEDRLLVIVRWRDADAIEAALGPDWEHRLVPIDGEEELLAREPHLYHFQPVGDSDRTGALHPDSSEA